ncbi:MAG: type I polyketide synthase, partial [Bacteriovoracales bacterium]|nr:type I polyketide synthase [Bacteriovoracales bacterium]
SFLQREVASVLRLPKAPDATVGFFDLGMDSLMAVEFRNRLNQAFDGQYTAPNTVVFDYPDITTLAAHIAQQFSDKSDSPPPSPSSPRPNKNNENNENHIAIVGMACRFPGAPDLGAYWDLLERGENAVTDGRQDGAPWKGVLGDPKDSTAHPILRRGGFIHGIDQFDAKFFGIPPIEAKMMDPRQRLLLETSWQALENANLNPQQLKGHPGVGIYVGMGHSEYRDLIAAAGLEDSYFGTAASIAVGRVAFALSLNGPAMPLDMSCASSLAAVHQAVTALQRGEVDTAIVAGVHAIFSSPVAQFLWELGMLSSGGQCRAFDAEADGFVRGEGCGVVVLRRQDQAQAEGNPIWALIRGSALNQNGAGAGLTVPNGPAQQEVIRKALQQAGVPPFQVDYLEAQGTGSPLGDPIEVQAAATVYGEGRGWDRPLLMGSVKGNIGHLESAAGMAGLIKTVLSIKRKIIPRQLHFNRPSPQLNWDLWPVRVVAQMEDWPLENDRHPLAGISAFGLSGANAHVIIEGHEDERPWPSLFRNRDPFERRRHWFS